MKLAKVGPCMILHYDECWYRSGHECPDLPDETELQKNNFNCNTITHTIAHNPLTDIVLGDLTMAGCYVDWDLLKKGLMK